MKLILDRLLGGGAGYTVGKNMGGTSGATIGAALGGAGGAAAASDRRNRTEAAIGRALEPIQNIFYAKVALKRLN